jgi:putative radical SAM enzyme (TIGR03279 family)
MISNGVKIEGIHPGSIGDKTGIKEGDYLLRINDKVVRDVIDYHFYMQENRLKLELRKEGGKRWEIEIEKGESEDIGLELSPFKIRQCRNRCVFCFVNHLPKGMRKSLYIKDEDYRMSFLYGNYVTLTNISAEDKKRIYEERLSPLYISVHATDKKLRNHILGNPNAPDIMKEIKELVSHKITIHAQIVLCPGINDGSHLIRTVEDLGRFYPYVSSIAVVPVGLTKYRKNSDLRPYTQDEAIGVVKSLEHVRKRFRKKHGDTFVYPSDEFYIKAGLDFPPLKEYGDFPQIENGVGLVPVFIDRFEKGVKEIKNKEGGKVFTTFTAVSFSPFLKRLSDKLNMSCVSKLEVVTVQNRFFGDSVTVTGLLTGQDIIGALKGKVSGDTILIPSITLRDGGDMFLDGMTPGDIEDDVGIRTKVIDATAGGLIGALLIQ